MESELNYEKERQLKIIQSAIEAERSLRDITTANLNARISGLKEVLTDYEALTKGGALRAILEPLGKNFLSRQIDLLFNNLFDPSRGIFKEIGKAIGEAGEFEAITEAHILGAKANAEALNTGSLTVNRKTLSAFFEGSNIAYDSIFMAHVQGADVVAKAIGTAYRITPTAPAGEPVPEIPEIMELPSNIALGTALASIPPPAPVEVPEVPGGDILGTIGPTLRGWAYCS